MICVSLGKISFPDALKLCREEELVEIRADLSDFNNDQLEELMGAGAEIVFTCRKSAISEDRRGELYQLALDQKVKYIDLDFDQDEELLVKLKPFIVSPQTELILSIHDYEKTPPSSYLKEKMSSMKLAGADIIKLACMVNSDKDMSRLFSLYDEPGRKIILGMGKNGILTRVAALFMGAEFSFAFPDAGDRTAPGQLTKRDLNEILEIMGS